MRCSAWRCAKHPSDLEADQAITKLTGWTDAQVANRQTLIARANLYSGYSYALLGMAMCQASFRSGSRPSDHEAHRLDRCTGRQSANVDRAGEPVFRILICAARHGDVPSILQIWKPTKRSRSSPVGPMHRSPIGKR